MSVKTNLLLHELHQRSWTWTSHLRPHGSS